MRVKSYQTLAVSYSTTAEGDWQSNFKKLDAMVEKLVLEGWQPLGGLSNSVAPGGRGLVAQAMVRYGPG